MINCRQHFLQARVTLVKKMWGEGTYKRLKITSKSDQQQVLSRLISWLFDILLCLSDLQISTTIFFLNFKSIKIQAFFKSKVFLLIGKYEVCQLKLLTVIIPEDPWLGHGSRLSKFLSKWWNFKTLVWIWKLKMHR